LRDELVPLNRRFPLAKLLEACAAYPIAKRDRLSFEYALLAGVNDSDADALALAKIALEARAKINLIPMNEHPGSPYRRPSEARIDAFLGVLSDCGVGATLRRSRGDDIFATFLHACHVAAFEKGAAAITGRAEERPPDLVAEEEAGEENQRGDSPEQAWVVEKGVQVTRY
jgi:23S rRNA (adenine2503-C2)-methyltransferase